MSILASNNVFPHDPDDNWRSKTDKGGCELTAQELLNKINEFVAPDDIIVPGTISKVGSVISILALAFTCRIDQQILRNIDDYSTTIANASVGFNRIDILVFTKFSTIIKIQGTESILDVQEPPTPEGTLKLAFISVFGSEVLNPEVPIANGLFKEKSESQNILVTGSGEINVLTVTDERTSIVFTDAITKLNTIRYPWEVAKVYNGKIVTLHNRQLTDVIIAHASSGGSVDFNFPDSKDYVLKPNQVISFFYDLSFYPYAHHMYIGEVGKEEETNKKTTVIGNEASDLFYGTIKSWITYLRDNWLSSLATKVIITDTTMFPVEDELDSNKAKVISWLNIKNTIKAFLDALFQAKDNQIEISANSNVLNSWHGQTILFTASCTITVPSTLNDSLMFPFRTLSGVTVTWAITLPFTWETTPNVTGEKTVGHFMRRGVSNTIILDA